MCFPAKFEISCPVALVQCMLFALWDLVMPVKTGIQERGVG